MFGVVPKSIWNKLNPADANNMCSWAMRCLLIEEGDRLILIDTGLGNKQDAKFFGYYFLHGDQTLHSSLKEKGFHPDDITDVVLTHLHFDHCGGAIERNLKSDGFRTAFKNATYWCTPSHWDWATVKPNPREKASFLSENILPIKESGQLKFIEMDSANASPFAGLGLDFIITYGHTEGMILPRIQYKGYQMIYMADLIPSVGHIPLPYVMAYDVRPMQTMDEKKDLLSKAVTQPTVLFFEHDPAVECCTLKINEKGIISADQIFTLSNLG